MSLFTDNGGFHQAREPWIPKYVDILVRRTEAPTQEERDYYNRFGIDKCEWPSTARLTAAKSDIVQYFEERYVSRRINTETLEIWQTRLQRKLDEIAPRYERAMQLYADNAAGLGKVAESATTTYNNLKDEKGGQDTVVSSSVDTPDSVVNASDNYADSRRTTTDSGNRSSTRSGSVTVEREPEGGILENINRNAADWRNLIVDFAAEFENLFLNVFWY